MYGPRSRSATLQMKLTFSPKLFTIVPYNVREGFSARPSGTGSLPGRRPATNTARVSHRGKRLPVVRISPGRLARALAPSVVHTTCRFDKSGIMSSAFGHYAVRAAIWQVVFEARPGAASGGVGHGLEGAYDELDVGEETRMIPREFPIISAHISSSVQSGADQRRRERDDRCDKVQLDADQRPVTPGFAR